METELTYQGKNRPIFIINTNRKIDLKDGMVIKVNEKELAEIKKQPRLVTAFKELKPKKKESEPGGDESG